MRPSAQFLGALTLALGLGALSAACGAAEMRGGDSPSGVGAVLASIIVLPDAAMANQTATGLRFPAIVGGAPTHPTVTLWDEMKPMPQLPPVANGAVSTTFGSVGK